MDGDALDRAADLLRDRQRILVFTGAGISTESGIPDFRGPQGVWTRVDPNEFTIDRYLTSAGTRRRSWQMRAESHALGATPNRAHRAVADLWKTGRMVGCVTQNIDGLHQAGGLPGDALVEVHGNVHDTVCLECRDRQPTAEVLARVAAGDEDPHCMLCNGILKTTVVMFGEAMPPLEMQQAWDWALRADAVLAVGSTLSVFPAASIPLEIAGAGHPMVILNMGATEFDTLATARIEAPAGEALPRLVRALR
jgi:NAD-dependent deacetylase